MSRSLLILGATGSIGTTALNAIRTGKLDVTLTGLVGGHDAASLSRLGQEFGCPCTLNSSSEVLKAFLEANRADIALNAIAGAAGLEASLLCLQAGMDWTWPWPTRSPSSWEATSSSARRSALDGG